MNLSLFRAKCGCCGKTVQTPTGTWANLKLARCKLLNWKSLRPKGAGCSWIWLSELGKTLGLLAPLEQTEAAAAEEKEEEEEELG